MTHRPPTAADIGKTVEVSSDGVEWQSQTLVSIGLFENHESVACVNDGRGTSSYWNHCRVPYTCPDPIAELSEAADLLAERGAPEAARVLMANIEARELIDRIVVSEGIDAGVIWLSAESRTQWNNERQRSEYVNPYFSELGEALVKLSRLIKGTAQCNLES